MDEDTKKFLKSIVFKYIDSDSVRVFLFGSRATGTNARYSDIDLGLEAKIGIPYRAILDIEEEFENSNLPYVVDVVDFSKVSDKFKKIASQNKMYLN